MFVMVNMILNMYILWLKDDAMFLLEGNLIVIKYFGGCYFRLKTASINLLVSYVVFRIDFYFLEILLRYCEYSEIVKYFASHYHHEQQFEFWNVLIFNASKPNAKFNIATKLYHLS